MKHGTENKLKFKKLQRRLDLALWQCKGLLQTLWDFAKANAPRGDVGRYTDDELAIGIDWRGDAKLLVDALVDNGWLDPAEDPARLIIHDWWEHCEDSIHMQLARHRQIFADGQRPKLTRIERGEREQIIADYERLCANGATHNHTTSHAERTQTHEKRTTGTGPEPEPCLAKPNHTNTGTGTTPDRAAPPAERTPELAPIPDSVPVVRSGVFTDVGMGTIRDPERTDAWWRMAAAQRPKPVISSSEQDRLFVHGAAVRALETKAGNNVAIFVSLVAKRLRENITQAQERKAEARIKQLDAAAREQPP